MKNNLVITPEAERDIYAITANILQQVSAETAKSTIVEFQKQFNDLVEHPESGREGGCEGTREIVMKGLPYIAVYEQSAKTIIILRVLYGADDRRQERRA